MSKCQAPQNPGLALPRVQVNKRDGLNPSLLGCCGNIAGQAGAGEGWDPRAVQRTSRRPESSKGQAGAVREQEASCVGEDVG